MQWKCQPQEAVHGYFHPISSTEVSPSFGSTLPRSAGYLYLGCLQIQCSLLSQYTLPVFPSLVTAALIHILYSKSLDPEKAPQAPVVTEIPDILFLSSVFSKKEIKTNKNFHKSLGYLTLSKKGCMVTHRQKR